MRNLLILAGVGVLGVAAWTVTLAAGPPGHGSTSASPAYGSLVVYPRYIQYHTEYIGGIFPIVRMEMEVNPSLFPGLSDIGLGGQDNSAGGAIMGGESSIVGDHQGVADHQGFADHQGGPPSHPHGHAAGHGENGQAVTPQATADHAESDQAGAAPAQPNPNVSPWSPRPPGSPGPGRRVSGTRGPGRPGPGRRAVPRS
jgi:hypothetical protein